MNVRILVSLLFVSSLQASTLFGMNNADHIQEYPGFDSFLFYKHTTPITSLEVGIDEGEQTLFALSETGVTFLSPDPNQNRAKPQKPSCYGYKAECLAFTYLKLADGAIRFCELSRRIQDLIEPSWTIYRWQSTLKENGSDKNSGYTGGREGYKEAQAKMQKIETLEFLNHDNIVVGYKDKSNEILNLKTWDFSPLDAKNPPSQENQKSIFGCYKGPGLPLLGVILPQEFSEYAQTFEYYGGFAQIDDDTILYLQDPETLTFIVHTISTKEKIILEPFTDPSAVNEQYDTTKTVVTAFDGKIALVMPERNGEYYRAFVSQESIDVLNI